MPSRRPNQMAQLMCSHQDGPSSPAISIQTNSPPDQAKQNISPTPSLSVPVKDPILFPSQEITSRPLPLFGPQVSAVVEQDTDRIIRERIRATGFSNEGQRPTCDEYRIVLALMSNVMQQFQANPVGWLNQEKALLAADHGASCHSRSSSVYHARPVAKPRLVQPQPLRQQASSSNVNREQTPVKGKDRRVTKRWRISTSSDTTGAQASHNGSSQQQNLPSQPIRSLKRELDNSGDRAENDGDDDRGKRPKLALTIPTDIERRYKRLVCPFVKRFPEAKWKGACCKPGFPSVHRLKEHIYRSHVHPYCLRCHATFPNDKDLTEHARAEPPCTVPSEPPPLHWITQEQHKSLKSRKRPNGKADVVQTEEDKWTGVYSLLFPDVLIPSPYIDLEGHTATLSPDAVSACEEFLVEQLPALLARELQKRLQVTQETDSAVLQTQLFKIIQSCIQQALSNWGDTSSARSCISPR